MITFKTIKIIVKNLPARDRVAYRQKPIALLPNDNHNSHPVFPKHSTP